MGLFVGGLAQFMAGMWEFPRGNVYGSAFFTLYGAFWMSYAVILFPGTGIAESYTGNDFNDAIGLYFMVWFIITFFFFLAVIRRSISFSILTFFWALSYLFFSISRWTTRVSIRLSIAGGAFGFVTAVVALYIGLSQIHSAEYSLFRMPLGHIGPLQARVGDRGDRVVQA
jgi:succinate-acetate transporter protein